MSRNTVGVCAVTECYVYLLERCWRLKLFTQKRLLNRTTNFFQDYFDAAEFTELTGQEGKHS